MVKSTILFFACLYAVVASAEDGPNMRLFQPAMKLNVCIERATSNALSTINRKIRIEPNRLEGMIFGKVMDECIAELYGYETSSLIYANYEGDISKIRAYREGLLWSGRAYVFSRVDDWVKSLD